MLRLTLALAVLVLIAGCGGGSSAGQASSSASAGAGLREVEEHHPNGRLAAKGTVMDEGSLALRHGAWQTWHDNGQIRWEGEYRRDAIAQDRHWREWNADGSIRDDASDGD